MRSEACTKLAISLPERSDDDRESLRRFESLLDRSEARRLAPVTFDETRELARLYRRFSRRLAQERELGDDPATIRHLNALCVRGYTLLYAGPTKLTTWRRATASDLARLLGRCWPALRAAWLLLFIGLLVGAALVRQDPSSIHAFVPSSLGYDADLLDRLATSSAAREEFLRHVESSSTQRAIFGSTLFAHNTRVGLLSFGAGILGGIPTALLQLYNGIAIGAFTTVFLADPAPLAYLAWILPHAVSELTAISLCAAAGLLLGAAVVAPGRVGRAEALRAGLAPALLMVATSVPLFLTAAFIESFVRESNLGLLARLSVAFVSFATITIAVMAIRRSARHRGIGAAWLAELSAPVRSES